MDNLTEIARGVRRDIIRMTYKGGGSPGSSLSAVEILVWLMCKEMKSCDRLILSKGQCAPAYYSLLNRILPGGLYCDLDTFRKFKGLPPHPEYPSTDFPCGSLGMGLSGANGMALAARLKGDNKSRFFVLMGDGELQEGQVWEAAMTTAHLGLNNVVVIVDRNEFQGDSSTEEQMGMFSLYSKFEAFNWNVAVCWDGHDFEDLADRLIVKRWEDCPFIIIAKTIKGKGVSFMEADPIAWHTAGPKFTEELYEQAMEELA